MERMFSLLEPIVPNEAFLWWLGIGSVVMFVGTLIAIPLILVRLPAHFFDERVARSWMKGHHPVLRVLGHLAKNLVGAIFVLAGVAMLVLPGQGILTMLIGLSFLDFPGKRRMEAKLVGQPTVFKAVNGIREKFGKPPFTLPPDQQDPPPQP